MFPIDFAHCATNTIPLPRTNVLKPLIFSNVHLEDTIQGNQVHLIANVKDPNTMEVGEKVSATLWCKNHSLAVNYDEFIMLNAYRGSKGTRSVCVL
jgi:hypothetical protein